MAKMTANERREAILDVLCKRRFDKVENLAHEFDVSVRTIKYDIEILSLNHPLFTKVGAHGGGVYVQDGYFAGKKYLKPEQKELLQRTLAQLTGSDAAVMESILRDFALN